MSDRTNTQGRCGAEFKGIEGWMQVKKSEELREFTLTAVSVIPSPPVPC